MTNDVARNLTADEITTFAAQVEAYEALVGSSPSSPDYHMLQCEWVDAVLAWRGAVARAHAATCEQYGIPHLHRVG
jgi:hypothetical protein